MPANLISIDQFVTDLERRAVHSVLDWLNQNRSEETWYIYANCYVLKGADPHGRLLEIDIVLIGPQGLHIIEIKGMPGNIRIDLLQEITKRHKTKVYAATDHIRRSGNTRHLADGPNKLKGHVVFCGPPRSSFSNDNYLWNFSDLERNGWGPLVGKPNWHMDDLTVTHVCQALLPEGEQMRNGWAPKVAGLKIDPRSPFKTSEQGFHRVYLGKHKKKYLGQTVHLHLWDLTIPSIPTQDARILVDREIDTLNVMQRWSPHVPRVVDTVQDVKGRENELCFYSYALPKTRSIHERMEVGTPDWAVDQRRSYTLRALELLECMHGVSLGDRQFVHRRLCPETLLVSVGDSYIARDEPVFTGFTQTRIDDRTIASVTPEALAEKTDYDAPEIRTGGIAQASQKSDIYSLCATLKDLFPDECDEQEAAIRRALDLGRSEEPSERSSLRAIRGRIYGTLPPFENSSKVLLHGHEYRIDRMAGEGSFGRTYKLVQERSGKQYCYAGKQVFEPTVFESLSDSLSRIQVLSTSTPHLSSVYEWESKWSPGCINVRFEWVDGTNLAEIGKSELSRLSKSVERTPLELVKEWLLGGLTALSILHDNELVHRDVSPGNLIIRASHVRQMVLIDYDQITLVGKPSFCGGTPSFVPPELKPHGPATADADVYSLAASVFHHAIQDRQGPLFVNGEKTKGLNWDRGELKEWEELRSFFLKATAPDPAKRFQNATEAREFLECAASGVTPLDEFFKKGEPAVFRKVIEDRHPGILSRLGHESNLIAGALYNDKLGDFRLAFSTSGKVLYRVNVGLSSLLFAYAVTNDRGYDRQWASIEGLRESLQAEFPHAEQQTADQLAAGSTGEKVRIHYQSGLCRIVRLVS